MKIYKQYARLVLLIFLVACSKEQEEQVKIEDKQSKEVKQEKLLEQKEEPIILTFAGDTMAAGKVAPILEQNGFQYPWENAKAYFENSDLTMINLETPVTLKGEPENKQYAYQSHPDLIKGAKWAGVDIVSLANNHSLDYGREAFHDTMTNLQKHDITYVGGGLNENEAFSQRAFNIKGKKVSFLAFSRVIPFVSWYANGDQSGIASGYQSDKVYEIVSSIANDTDILIVYMHWGKEMADEPNSEDVKFAYDLIDHGADVIIGAHPHVLQRLEYYKGKLIAYSLGNFIFTMSHHDIARQSAILKVTLESDGTQTAQVKPMRIHNGAVWETEEEESNEILKRLEALSKGIHWKDNGFLEQIK